MQRKIDAAVELSSIFSMMQVPLQVQDTPTQGKHVVATADIHAGDILFEEVAFVSWPMLPLIQFHVSFCWNCLRILTDEIAKIARHREDHARVPVACGDAMFCSEECRAMAEVSFELMRGAEGSLREFHAAESKRMSLCDEDDDDVVPISVESVARCVAQVASRFVKAVEKQHLQDALSEGSDNSSVILRAVFDAAVKPLNRFVEPPAGTKFDGFDVHQWCDVVKKTMQPQLLRVLTERCSASNSSTSSPPKWVVDVVDGLTSFATLNTILGQLSINSQAINVVVGLTSSGEEDIAAAVGAGLYTLQSAFNHSCLPNAEVIQINQTHEIAIRAIKDIPSGSDVTISYLPPKLPYGTRLKKLAAYFFQCSCAQCSEEGQHHLHQHVDPSS